QARQGLDDYHCAQYLHRVAQAHYGASVQAVEWGEATMTRLYLVVASFLPHSLGLVKLLLSAYPAALLCPYGRSTSDALCAFSPALVGRYERPLAGHRFCTRHASHPAVGRYLSLGSARQRYQAEFRPAVPDTIPAWPTARAYPCLVCARIAQA